MTNIAQPQPNFRDAPYGLPNGLEVTTSVPVDSEEDMTVKERLLKKLAGVKNNVFRAMQRNDLAEEQAEKREKLLENLEQQYPRMVEVLETYE